MGKGVSRLFEQFKPEHYELSLDIDRAAMTFRGTVTIKGRKTGRPSQRLTFHQKDLNVTEATIVKHDKKGDEKVVVDRINAHQKLTEVRLHTTQKLMPGEYTVTMTFTAKLTRPMQGIYPCFFKHEGKEKLLIATQFESHHAREAFPCIDEPEAKAVFELTLTSPTGDTVLSNTPTKTQKKAGDHQVTIFEPTPRMSTYLLAFVMGEMHSVESKTKDGVAVRSWASVAQDKSHLEYSVAEAVNILDFFSEYFGTPYPLAKCDQVALPDFDAGAMENWGLITYREVALLADPANRSISGEQYVSLVVAHELSHQWFGNLVTMKWWDDLWLNESFASLMEHLALDALHPDWQQWEMYAASDVLATSSRDIYKDIQPVGVTVDDPELIETLFDPGIVYAKGGRLLKMLREYIGEDAFRSGLREYFKKHAYGNATREDLWVALSGSSKRDVGALMTPWLTKPGMPVVEVTQDGAQLDLRQSRFMLDAPADKSLWPVPLLANQPLEPEIFSTAETRVKASSSDYVLLNQHGSGHYFVHYMVAKHREYLAKQFEARQMPTETRINLLNDTYMLARHGDAQLTDALELSAAGQHEDRENVWALIGRTVSAAGQLTEGDKKAEQQLKTLRVKLAANWYNKLGWDDAPDDDPNTKQLRRVIVGFMIGGEAPEAIAEALKRYKAAKSINTLQAELRAIILISAVRHGNSDVIDRLIEEYQHATAEVQSDICAALTSTEKPEVAQAILGKALGKDGFVRAQDIMRWLAMFLRNHHVRDVAWNFMVKEWDWLASTLRESKSFDYLPTYAASVVSTDEWAAKYRELFEPKQDIKVLARNIKIGLADIDARVAWRKRDEAAIKQWLVAKSSE